MSDNKHFITLLLSASRHKYFSNLSFAKHFALFSSKYFITRLDKTKASGLIDGHVQLICVEYLFFSRHDKYIT